MRCHICGLLMVFDEADRSLPVAASIDHLLTPAQTSRGLLSNLRAAHRACNSLRHHEPVTDALVLKTRDYLIMNSRDGLLRAGETPRSLTLALLAVSAKARKLWMDRFGSLPAELRHMQEARAS